MERRLLTFIVASTAFLLVYLSLQAMFVPPQAPKPPADLADAADGLVVPGEANALAGDGTVIDQADASGSPSVSDSDPKTDAETETEPARSDQPEWITLGSMDPASGYFVLVTLNTRGAGIERVELTERNDDDNLRYRRVDVRHGYLGYLAVMPATDRDGVIINVVGPGTPADIAGLQVGDVIVSLGGRPVLTRAGVEDRLLETEPGDVIKVGIIRGDDETPIETQVTLSEHPLDMMRLAQDGGADQVDGNLSRQSCLMMLSQVNRKTIGFGELDRSGFPSAAGLVWEGQAEDVPANDTNGGQSASFELSLSAGEMATVGGKPVRLKRSYTVMPGDYSIDMALQVDNLADESQDLAYRLEGPNGLTLEGWWYSNKISPNFSGAAARDVVYNTATDGHRLVSGYELLKLAKKTPENPGRPIFAPDMDDAARSLNYIAIDAQYFAAAYLPPPGQTSFNTFRRAVAGVAADATLVPANQERAVNATFYLESVVATVPPGGSLRQEMQLFAGPKDPEVLQQYGLGDLLYYGWFAILAKWLGSLLHVLAGVGNYALAIILLTVIVRGAMFPLSRKAAVNAQKMQELAPELKKITERYKDDLEGRMKAQRELQKRVGFNPMAGCLPMFLQLPIFIGLYRTLSVDIELRQQPFFGGWDWASNLAGPDMLAYWGDWLWEYLSGRGTGWLGPYFNILPVIVVGLFLAQQKMFMPPATDEQTAMTQKMMNIMTLMMGLFFFRVPAGLCIYFITSSLWGIGERILVKKTLPKTAHFDQSVLEGTAEPTPGKPNQGNLIQDKTGSSSNGKTESLADRVRNKISAPEPTFDRPNKRKRPKKK